MKTLAFKREYLGPILNGSKRVTIRKRIPKVKEGDLIRIECGGKIIGIGKVCRVEKIRFGDLSDEIAKLDGFENAKELKKALRKHYKGLKSNDQLILLEFEMLRRFEVEPYEFHYGGKSLREIARKGLRMRGLSRQERWILEQIVKGSSIRKVARKLGGLEKRKMIRRLLRRIACR